MLNVLWIAPRLNHYKTRVLNRLSENNTLKLTVLAGAHMSGQGHIANKEKETFSRIDVSATKIIFNIHPAVYIKLLRLLIRKRFNVVLMPVEKKHIFVILYLFILKFFLHYKLVSYNHPLTGPKKGKYAALEKIITRFIFTLYDKVIFYTSQGKEWAIENHLISYSKAFFANNTLDTKLIGDNYSFDINTSEVKTILFIGRLVPNKNIDMLFANYMRLKKLIPLLRLIIIGDGPMSYKVKEASQNDTSIIWRGVVIDEKIIARDMRQSHVVFAPGHTGLSIVHAFSYGKPYIALSSYNNHPPEFDYLVDGVNGLLLTGIIDKDCERLASFLFDPISYRNACKNAFETAKNLSIKKWCQQVVKAIES